MKGINDSEKESLVTPLRYLNGVIAPHFNKDRKHLLLAAYNSEVTNSRAVLRNVRNKGCAEQLVGL